MAHIHGCHMTSREAMLFMKYEHYGKCHSNGSFKDSQRKCKFINLNGKKSCLLGATLHDTTSQSVQPTLVQKAICQRRMRFLYKIRILLYFDSIFFIRYVQLILADFEQCSIFVSLKETLRSIGIWLSLIFPNERIRCTVKIKRIGLLVLLCH